MELRECFYKSRLTSPQSPTTLVTAVPRRRNTCCVLLPVNSSPLRGQQTSTNMRANGRATHHLPVPRYSHY
ncbi:hypothetical protein E2C01_071955 [Portunus trituberculatus]|uniref:Uncharacterized protein n=1 Tax=Portunus trituberculatus TaxID=210409 RepID=A0A5B7I6H3_PORTR|nr:hypothetical protein [Portunus trituberculatus]